MFDKKKYLMRRDGHADKQLKVLEMICCFTLCLLLMGCADDMKKTEPEPNRTETVSTEKPVMTDEAGTWTENDSPSSVTVTDAPVTEEKTLVKILAEYDGSTKAGTVLDKDNVDISVMGTYSDGTTEEIPDDEYEINKPVTLKAGKTSTVKIICGEKKCKLKVKCTSKKHRKGKKIVGISDKDIHDVDAAFSANKVRNDITGNWKISTIANNIKMEEYALSYYKWKFRDDEEIHAIVNFNYKTTTQISVMGDMLDVTVFEYVDGEEHDANILFSGMLLQEYSVYLDNGDIEKIQ